MRTSILHKPLSEHCLRPAARRRAGDWCRRQTTSALSGGGDARSARRTFPTSPSHLRHNSRLLSFIGAALWAKLHGLWLLHRVALPPIAVVLITLLVRAFIWLFTHYLDHMVPLF